MSYLVLTPTNPQGYWVENDPACSDYFVTTSSAGIMIDKVYQRLAPAKKRAEKVKGFVVQTL